MKNLIKNTKEKMSFSTIMILLITTFLFTGCDDDDDDNGSSNTNSNVVQVISADSELNTLETAVLAVGLETALSGDGPFTIFAPTDAAFAALDPTILNNIISTPSLLTSLLQYHVVSGKVESGDLTNGMVPTLLSGQNIDVNINNGVVLNGSSNVIEADIQASNGVIHKIDAVLLPEDFVAETIVQIAASNAEFSTLVGILGKPELKWILDAANDPTQDLTVFAPTNDAFEALLAALGKNNIDELPVTLLEEIVSYHILGESIESSEMSDGDKLTTLLDPELLDISIVNGDVIINNSSTVVLADVSAVNGVIHAVDNVLLPSYVALAVGSISEVIMFDPNYTILVNALTTADLLNTLSTADDLTLFAPDNAAFIAAGITSLDGLDAATLSPILLYHVLGAKVLSSELPADGMATTLNGEKIYLGYLTNSVLINGLTTINAVDIEKNNGVVHTINRTLVPPAIDIVDIAVAMSDMGDNSEFTVLVSILSLPEYSDIAQAIKDLDNVTLFAPTDAAFAEIEDVLPTLTEEQVRNVLTYHAASARVFSTQLVDGQVLPMLNGETLTVNINSGGTSLTDMSMGDDAGIIEVNVHGSNGVIHVIDKVLIPTL